jgi:CheY-like chemotaxis protein
VRDTGGGMDQATLEHIFEPFFTTKGPRQGTGLGLAVVHGIMKGHKGAVTVTSEPGRGSTFHLLFPVAETAVAQDPGIGAKIIPGHGERVLCVDDEELVLSGTTRVLQRLGYQVSSHTDAVQALQAFRSRPHDYDALVCDLAMPGMSGLDFVREVLQVRPGTPVILTTGYLSPEDTEAAQRAGVRHLLLKPGTIEKLGQALRDALSEGNGDGGRS